MAERPKKKKPGAAAPKSADQRQSRAKSSPHPPRELLNCQHMHALSHPTRVEMLAILAERIASPVEMSRELNGSVTLLAYHVKALEECGLIAEDHQVQRRGAVEHFFKSNTPTIIPPGAWDNLPAALRRDISAKIMREFFEDASESLKAGAFDNGTSELSWTPLILDSPGVSEMEKLSEEFMQSVFDVQERASARLRDRDGGTNSATSATVFLASFLSARSPAEGKKASATKRR